jgi:hypothetical protein
MRRVQVIRQSHSLLRPAGGLLAAAALFAGITCTTSATTVVKLDMAEMVQRADAIVIGHARSAESVWVGRELYTRYRIEVQEQLLGAAATEVYVVVPGGMDRTRPRPIAVTIEDAPMLRSDEHVALLLKRGSALGAADYTIVGFNQGRIGLDRPAGPAAATRGAVTGDAVVRAKRVERLRQRLQPLIDARGPAATRSDKPETPLTGPRGRSEVFGGGRQR